MRVSGEVLTAVAAHAELAHIERMIKTTAQRVLALARTCRVLAIKKIIVVRGFHEIRLIAVQLALHPLMRIRQALACVYTVLMRTVLFIQHFFFAILKQGIIHLVYAFIDTKFLAFHRPITISTNRIRKIMKKLAIILTAIRYPARIHLLSWKKNFKDEFEICKRERADYRRTDMPKRERLERIIIPIDSYDVVGETLRIFWKTTSVVMLVASA